MSVVPLTRRVRTGDVVEKFQRHILRPAELSEWAEELLVAGVDNDDVVFAAANPDLHWQQVNSRFAAICRQLGLSKDVEIEITQVKRNVMIDEFRHGRRTGAELLHCLDDLRREVRFPELIVLRLMEDNDDGTNDSGYYSTRPGYYESRRGFSIHRVLRCLTRRFTKEDEIAQKITGDELEAVVCEYLARGGITRHE